MLLDYLIPEKMAVINELFEPGKKLLSKLPKNTLVTIIIVLACLYGTKLLKEGKAWQETVIKKQDAIEKRVVEGFSGNRKQHKEIMIDLQEVKQEQKIIIETVPEESKKMIEQVQGIYDQMRKDQEEKNNHQSISINEIKSIYPDIDNGLLEDITMTFESDTIKKNICLEN